MLKLKLSVYSIFSGGLFVLFLFTLMFSVVLVYYSKSIFIEWSFLSLISSEMSMGLLLDWVSLSFLSVVSLISSSIFKYCDYYMEGEKNYLRFFFLLFFFVTSMWFLIISPNLVSLLLGWDGLGLTSYALVIFYQSESSCNAGMLTVLSNRVGDVAILLSIGLLSLKGDWTYIYMDSMDINILLLVGLAGMTKSAQVPFSAWLPAAMAAPTPVSALVHSSTLVTAGVFLLVRFSEFLKGTGVAQLLLWAGILTMCMAGLNANFEGDMKKIVALSTLSQLGLMFMSLGFGLSMFVYFHLVVHALFKSVLFMCAGFMIHNVKGGQDLRLMSGFGLSSPVLCCILGISNMALCGFPFLAGFYSKDLILELMFSGGLNIFLTFMIVMGTGFTVSYSLRLFYKSLNSLSFLSSVSSTGDLSTMVFKSMSLLSGLSCLGGYFFLTVFYYINPVVVMSNMMKYLIMLIILVMGIFFFFMNESLKFQLILLNGVMWRYLVSLMLFLPKLSVNSGDKALVAGLVHIKSIELGWSEVYGSGGGKLVLNYLVSIFQAGQKGMMVSYLLSMGILLIVMFV
uniref:NADH-ubiquinone oxidoreductase chain 5 n=1 Tax=Epimeria cornigera TaxID=1582882 RepID=A0A2S1TMB8_9CRUS|nr:NADH dehydrogenase subunit 5 [Epimeria cornigera]